MAHCAEGAEGDEGDEGAEGDEGDEGDRVDRTGRTATLGPDLRLLAIDVGARAPGKRSRRSPMATRRGPATGQRPVAMNAPRPTTCGSPTTETP